MTSPLTAEQAQQLVQAVQGMQEQVQKVATGERPEDARHGGDEAEDDDYSCYYTYTDDEL